MEFITEDKKKPFSNAVVILLILLSVFVAIKALNELRYGSHIDDQNRDVITVDGHGEAFAVPDTAVFSFTVRAEASTVVAAQEEVTNEGNDIIAYLEGEGVEEKNIKTIGYNVYPRYEYRSGGGISGRAEPLIYPPVPEGERTLVGYEVSHTIEVKVTDPQVAGTLLAGVGERGVDSISGISFTVEDEDAIVREARRDAIENAREKAEQLADDLGVHLGDVVSFSESGGGYYPLYYEKAALGRGEATEDAVAPAPDLPTGENRVTAYVSISFEIK